MGEEALQLPERGPYGSSAMDASQQVLSGHFLHVVGERALPDEAQYPDRGELRYRTPHGVGHLAAGQLKLVEPVTDSEGNEAVDPYNPLDSRPKPEFPHRHFVINHGWMRGSGVVAATEDSRSRAVFTALYQTFPELEGPSMQTTRRNLQRLQDLGKAKITLVEGEPELTKADILSLTDAVASQMQDLGLRNHPVAQLSYQLREEFADLPPGMLKSLETQLVVSAAFENIKAAYRDALNAARLQALASQT